METPAYFNALLPPLLLQIGYASQPSVEALGKLGTRVSTDFVGVVERWAPWRGIFEYLSCVELARLRLKSLPAGRGIGTEHCLAARYDSASLVFFAQATLDQTAAWLTQELRLRVRGRHRQLHKTAFLVALEAAGKVGAEMACTLEPHRKFFAELERFRQSWIHSLAGGAAAFAERAPNKGGIPNIAVPIDPTIGLVPSADYYTRLEQCRRTNGGRWLYSIAEFADRFADGAKVVTLAILSTATKSVS